MVIDGMSDVGQPDACARASHPLRQCPCGRGDSLRCLAGHHQRGHRRVRFPRHRRRRRGLLHDDVCVCSADTEGGHPGAAGVTHGRPFQGLRGDGEAGGAFACEGGQCVEVEVFGDVAVFDAEHGLDESGDARRGFEMAQVGLHRAQHQRRRTVAIAEHLAERVELDRIAQPGSGAVRLDVVDIRGRQPRCGQGLPHQSLLGGPVGHRLPAAGAVLVHRRPAHHCQHPITGVQRVAEPLEHHDPAALAAHIPVGSGIEGLALAIRRQHPEPRTRDAVLRAQHQVDAGGKGGVALAAAQALAGQVHRHQRRRARRVDDHRRAAHPEEIRQPARGEIRRVAERHIGVDVLRLAAVRRRSASSRWWSCR